MKRRAPAAARNREPIAKVLQGELPSTGLVLEIASGTGEHALHFARRFPELVWQPSDPDPDARVSIASWLVESDLANLLPPLRLDATSERWPVESAAAMVCINMAHISPWPATRGLFAGAERILPSGAPLVLYGPYIEAGVETVASNLEFDASLRQRNPEWGLRDLEDVDALARRHQFDRTRRVEMPANNLTVVYRKR